MAFFKHGHSLAQMFMGQKVIGKYLPSENANIFFEGEIFDGCMKPIEYFVNDIQHNLVEWSYEGEDIFYRTKKNWYHFSKDGTLVTMTCYSNDSFNRIDSWANLHSVDYMGKEFLSKHMDKKVKLFD